MRWFAFDRLLTFNIALLALDGLAPSLLGYANLASSVYLYASIALHLAMLVLLMRSPVAPLAPRERVLPPSDQAWLDGHVADNDLSDVERLVLANRRARGHRPTTTAR